MFRYVSLILVILIGAWALWPREGDKTEGGTQTAESGPPRKYTIRFAPGIYMPGRRPMDLGKPLKGLYVVAAEFEKLYPDTHIEFTEAPVGQREYLITQLAAEQAPEIINVNVEDVWEDVQKGWYASLDDYLDKPNPFIPKGRPGSAHWWDQFKYQAISRGKAAPDGKMYCITYDMVETGIFYNKDIFSRLGLSVPRDWNELIQVEEKIKKAGLIPMIVAAISIADWGLDLIFDQMYQSIVPGIDLTKDPKRDAYQPGYLDWDEIAFLNSKGFFTDRDPRYVETFRILKAWRPYFEKDMSSTQLDRMFISQEGAMYWTGSWMVNQLMRDPDVGFHWGVFYLTAIPRSYDRFADGHPMVVIGGSGTQFSVTNSAFNDTHDPATSEKLKRTIAFLQFLTVPRNVDRVVNEITAFLPNVVGVDPHSELLPFDKFLQRRYTTTKWLYTFDLRFNEILTRMLDLYLNNGIGEDEFMQWMESNVRTACETVVKRKNLSLSKFEPRWGQLAPVRAKYADLPSP
ncbi:MAG TPA: ABC transporter substrate-binding protein [Fimbriimonadaceae bacterium]|nr:ABC transporter substrate-binding protein [Fimbriimonadaceae bacterium]